MEEIISNYKVLFSLRIFKNILTTFVDSFFVLYFLDVSNSNILPLGIYKLIAVIAIFSVITCILGIIFAKFIKKQHYKTAIRITMAFTILFLCLMILKCNTITIVLFNLFQTISRNLVFLINNKNQLDLCNIQKIQKEYKVEYFLANETSLFIGRIISYTLFILMAYTNSNIIMLIFILLLIFYAQSSIKFQEAIDDEKSINRI